METETGGTATATENPPATPFDPPIAPKPAAPPAAPFVPRRPTFFQRVAKVEKADWGTRTFIYVYCLEPICNLKMGGETKYLVRLSEPIADEQALMIDYGSGKYRLQMVHRKPGVSQGDSLDVTEIEIYNPKYPPKIPRSVWMNDPRNERWAALLPKEEAPVAPTGLGTVTDAFKTFSDIRKDIVSEMAPAAAPPQNEVGKFTEMVTALKTIMPQAPASTDNTMLNTIVTLMTQQIQSSQAEAQQLRAQVFELVKQQTSAPRDPGLTLEAMLEKADVLVPKLKGLFNLGGEKLSEVVHGPRRSFWEQLALDVVPTIAQNAAPAIPFLLSRFGPQQPTAPVTNGMGGPAPTSAPQLPAAPANPMQALQQKVGAFLGANINPLQKHFEDFQKATPRDPEDKEAGTMDGSDFAEWICQYHGEQILKDARTLGSGTIMQMFRQSPYWAAIQPHEAKLAEFLDQVLRYEPEPAPDEPQGVVDLSGGSVE